MSYEPFKCPDCGTWWRGETHKCSTVSYTKPKKDIVELAKDLDLCIRCGRTYDVKYPHSCLLDEFRRKRPKPDNWKPKPKKPGHGEDFPRIWYNKGFNE